MEEENKITLDDLKTSYKTEDGQIVKTTILKSTRSTPYSLSKIDQVTSLSIPTTLKKALDIKVSRKLSKYFCLYSEAIRLQRIYKKAKRYRIKKKLNKRLYEKAYLMYELSRK